MDFSITGSITVATMSMRNLHSFKRHRLKISGYECGIKWCLWKCRDVKKTLTSTWTLICSCSLLSKAKENPGPCTVYVNFLWTNTKNITKRLCLKKFEYPIFYTSTKSIRRLMNLVYFSILWNLEVHAEITLKRTWKIVWQLRTSINTSCSVSETLDFMTLLFSKMTI